MSLRTRLNQDTGAIAVIYTIVFAFVLAPMLALGSTTLIRSTTAGELRRAADAGALAGAAAIPLGDVNFARNFLAATAGGDTDRSLRQMGLAYVGQDPLDVACAGFAMPNATDSHNVASHSGGKSPIATTPECHPYYLSDPSVIGALRDCAAGLVAPVTGGLPGGLPGTPTIPDLSPILPALLYPGVKVNMKWTVTGPLDGIVNGSGAPQEVTSIAHRRFKNMVVVPVVTAPTGDQINLNPYAGDVRAATSDAIDQTESLLESQPATAACATVLDDARDDILDAVDPPGGGPDAQQIIDDAIANSSPLVVAELVSSTTGDLSIPFLDFVPVCAEQVGGDYVGHLGDFGSCTLDAPGAFRASLRRS